MEQLHYLTFPGLFMSVERDKLYKALSQFQGEITSVPHNRKANYGAYADLDAILEHIRGPLSKFELSVEQFDCGDGDKPLLYTKVTHASGQFMMCYKEFKVSAATRGSMEQAYGSALSYYKRYQLVAFLGLNDGGDNDGEQNTTAKHLPPPPIEYIAAEQLQQLEHELREFPKITKTLKDSMGIETLNSIQKKNFQQILKRVRDIKRDEYGVV